VAAQARRCSPATQESGRAPARFRGPCSRAPETASCAPSPRTMGKVIWEFATARKFDTVNGAPGAGGGIGGTAPTIVDGIVYGIRVCDSGRCPRKRAPGIRHRPASARTIDLWIVRSRPHCRSYYNRECMPDVSTRRECGTEAGMWSTLIVVNHGTDVDLAQNDVAVQMRYALCHWLRKGVLEGVSPCSAARFFTPRASRR
jgi:hypothetical protein